MDKDSETAERSTILETLSGKATLKQRVADNTLVIFNELKETLHEFCTEIDEELDEKIDRRIRIEYRDKGKYEAQIQLADDILIFTMHTDVFVFDAQNPVWSNEYLREDSRNGYFGMINIYNFLSDSFKQNRPDDEGYLIGRIFVNHKMQYFTEGKMHDKHNYRALGSRQIDRETLIEIFESAIKYTLGFDLLVPPYDTSMRVTVEQFNTRTENFKLPTGKRLGYEFAADDIE